MPPERSHNTMEENERLIHADNAAVTSELSEDEPNDALRIGQKTFSAGSGMLPPRTPQHAGSNTRLNSTSSHRRRRSGSGRGLGSRRQLLDGGSEQRTPSSRRFPHTPQSNANSSSDSLITPGEEYTERTYYSSTDEDDNIFDLETRRGYKASGEDSSANDLSVAESSEGNWNQDDAIIYYSHSELNLPSLQRNASNLSKQSVSAQTLSSGFSLNDLGSIATVSSLGDYDSVDRDDVDDFGNNEITVDGVGLLSLGSLPNNGSSPLPPRRKAVRRSPHSQDTIDDLASLDSTDKKIRQVGQKIEAHQLREAFSPKHGHRKELDREEQFEDSFVDEEEEEILIEEIIEEEYVEEEFIEEDHDVQVRRITSAMHKSMVISWQSTEFSNIERGVSNRSLEDIELPSEVDNRQFKQSNPLDYCGIAGKPDFPNELSAAKNFLAQLAETGVEREDDNVSQLSEGEEEVVSHAGARSQQSSVLHSSDEYTEVLLSSDDSFACDADDEGGRDDSA